MVEEIEAARARIVAAMAEALQALGDDHGLGRLDILDRDPDMVHRHALGEIAAHQWTRMDCHIGLVVAQMDGAAAIHRRPVPAPVPTGQPFQQVGGPLRVGD